MTSLAAIARRSRWGHAVLFAVTVCLLVSTAAVEPMLTRSFSWALVRYHASLQGVVSGQVTLSGDAPTPFGKLAAAVDPRVRAVTSAPSGADYTNVNWTLGTARLQYTTGECAHVKMVSGRCPTGRNEVMLSKAGYAHTTHLRLGAKLPISESNPTVSEHPHKTMTLVGVFAADPDDPVWGGIDVNQFVQRSLPDIPTQYWLTSHSTFEGPSRTGSESKGNGRADAPVPTVAGWTNLQHSATFPIKPTGLTPARLRAAVDGLAATGRKVPSSVNISEPLSTVRADTRNDLDQVGQILPYLLLQLAIVLLILLAQVATFLATVRRGEAAVLRMRGNGTAGVIRLGAHEFLPSYVVGIVGGLGLAYGVDGIARHLWLPGNVGAQWNWISVVTGLAMAVLVGGVWFLCWWLTAREPISSLLRSRPPRRRSVGLSMPAAVLGVLCLTGVVLTATKNLTGAPVQVTPVLLAGLVAIVVGSLLARVAGWFVRNLLARGWSSAALAVAQLGRRAGVVIAVTTLIITSALLTLSISIVARGADNRAARTAADLGSAAVVHVSVGTETVSGQRLIDAVTSVDPRHRDFTPSVLINPSSPTSNALMGVIPADMQRIGARPGLQQNVPWSDLEHAKSASDPPALVSTWTTDARVGSSVTGPTMADVDGQFRVAGVEPYIPGAGERTLVVDLRTMLAAGDRRDSLSYQVFSATQDPKRLARLSSALRKAGFASTQVQRSSDVSARYAATATAWARKLSIVVSVLSLLAALTSVVLVAVASRRDRERDLRALRTGGVPRAVLWRATMSEFMLLALVGSVIAAVTAPLAAHLIGPTMLWWSTPPAQPVTRTGFDWQVGTVGAASLVVLLVVVGAVFGMRLACGSDRNVGRSTV